MSGYRRVAGSWVDHDVFVWTMGSTLTLLWNRSSRCLRWSCRLLELVWGEFKPRNKRGDCEETSDIRGTRPRHPPALRKVSILAAVVGVRTYACESHLIWSVFENDIFFSQLWFFLEIEGFIMSSLIYKASVFRQNAQGFLGQAQHVPLFLVCPALDYVYGTR